MPQRNTFRQLVANHFANRPTLRQVIATDGFAVLLDRYPWIATHSPSLKSLEAFTLLNAENANTGLVDRLLQHLVTGERLSLESLGPLSIAPPAVFRAQEQGLDATAQPQIDLDMRRLDSGFDTLLSGLRENLQQAQISYWNGFGESDVTRLRWLQQVIKASLLANIQQPGLDEDEQHALYTMLVGSSDGLTVSALQVSLSDNGASYPLAIPDLILTQTHGNRTSVLRCRPSGHISSHADLPALATSLQHELAESYRFESLSWTQRALSENVFAWQAAQVLNSILDRINRLRLGNLTEAGQLETVFSTITDPSGFFSELGYLNTDMPDIELPQWLANASDTDRFNYHAAMLELAASQGQSKGLTSLGDIDGLHRFANRRLREQWVSEYPDKAVHDPDQVFISIDQAVPSGPAGGGQSLFSRRVSLTDLAISRLQAGQLEAITAITDASHAGISGTLTIEEVESLVLKVDIGGHYCPYVRQMIDGPPGKTARIARFAKAWRSNLMLNALQATINKKLSEGACQALIEFSQTAKQSQATSMAPLAFLCAPGASSSDAVQGMYLISLPTTTNRWVLYRPLYPEDTILQFASLDALMNSVREGGDLQQSMLEWLDKDARQLYENGGFLRPHLHPRLSQLAHLVSPESAVVDTLLAKLALPVEATFKAWAGDLDAQMFKSRVDAMLFMATRSSVSNAQAKWALVEQIAWAVFNTGSMLLSGPAASAVWLLQAVATLKDDIPALLHGSEQEKAVAVTDLLTNLAMLLAHRQMPPPQARTPARPAPAARFAAPASAGLTPSILAEAPRELPWEPTQDEQAFPTPRVSHWRDSQRLTNLPQEQRTALGELQARLSLQGHAPIATGRLRGLYEVEGRHYVTLHDTPYEVQECWSGIQIIGPEQSQGEWQSQWGGEADGYHIVGRTRDKGPWISRWNGEWALQLRMAGGMPVKSTPKVDFQRMSNAVIERIEALEAYDETIPKNLLTLQTLDEQVKNYADTYKVPEQGDAETTPSQQQLDDLQALRALRVELGHSVKAASTLLEERAAILTATINDTSELCEPVYQQFGNKRYIDNLGNLYHLSIDNDVSLLNRLLMETDYIHLDSVARQLPRLPRTPEEIHAITQYREARNTALDISKRLLKASERLDRNLTKASSDPRIAFTNKQTVLAKATQHRPYSTVMLCAQTCVDLASLAFKRENLTPERIEHIDSQPQRLCGPELRKAVLNHDGLLASEQSLDDQIEVLSSVRQAYTASLNIAEELLALDDPAIDTQPLQGFVAQVTKLRNLAERALDAAYTERDEKAGHAQSVQAPFTPGPAHGQAKIRTQPLRKLKSIRTARHKKTLVEQTLKNGRAIQYDPLSQTTVSELEQHGDVWLEAPKVSQPGKSQKKLRSEGTRLVAQTEEEIRSAERYMQQPQTLADRLDQHMDKLTSIHHELNAESSPALKDNLLKAIKRTRDAKHQSLTTVYFNSQYPESWVVRALKDLGAVNVRRVGTRTRTADGHYLDIYRIDKIPTAELLWEAHFHYPSENAPAHAFTQGHLKLPKAKSRSEQLMRAANRNERLKIYGGDLLYERDKDIIPFPMP
ncbi:MULTISPECIES: dermonecrotic toxin domain-containing protein [unclassified Pseudomonas]|uniref:dermonecrotic toxin domain-containing protein n=1 Tax=unclassified Pseudomonas TaxID=196821 RepID=UPI00382784F3